MLKPGLVILNKFENEEPLLRVLREEYESLTETRPRLSGVCEIVSRLWNVRYNEKMKSKNHVNVDYKEPLSFTSYTMYNYTSFDFSTDFVSELSNMCVIQAFRSSLRPSVSTMSQMSTRTT